MSKKSGSVWLEMKYEDVWLHVNAPSGNKVSLNLGMRGSMNFDPTFTGRVLAEAAVAQVGNANAEVERLKGEVATHCVYYCVYCGERFLLNAPDAREWIGEHIKVCLKHPMREVEAEVERLKGEVRLLKESTKRLPELLWKTERYTEICDLLIRPRGEDVVGMVESIKKEWDELRAHTWQQERAAVAEWMEHEIPEGADVFDLFERIKRAEHWPTEGESND